MLGIKIKLKSCNTLLFVLIVYIRELTLACYIVHNWTGSNFTFCQRVDHRGKNCGETFQSIMKLRPLTTSDSVFIFCYDGGHVLIAVLQCFLYAHSVCVEC